MMSINYTNLQVLIGTCNMLPWSTQKPRAGTRLAYAQAKIFPIAPGFTLLKNLLSGPGSHTVQYTLR